MPLAWRVVGLWVYDPRQRLQCGKRLEGGRPKGTTVSRGYQVKGSPRPDCDKQELADSSTQDFPLLLDTYNPEFARNASAIIPKDCATVF